MTRLAAALALALLLVTTAWAADPQSDLFDQAVPIERATSGHLGPGGQFAYYRFSYSEGTVGLTLRVTPPLPGAGMKVYGPQPKKEYISGGTTGEISGTEPGVYTVQVYNYDPKNAVDFTLEPTGIAGAPPPEAPPPAAPPPSSDNNTYRGHLDAGTSGHFALYEFDYPGDQSVYSIRVTITPDNPQVMKAAGYKVYGPLHKNTPYLVGGYDQGKTPNVVGDLVTRDAGTYTVQIYNYDPVTGVDYEITLVPGPPAR